MNTEVEALMNRAEKGISYQQDSHVLFQALKSAAETHTNKQDMLKFLRYHIGRGIMSVSIFRKKQLEQEH